MSTLKDKIVIASSNKGKIKEFQSYFDSFGLILIPQKEMGVSDIEETGKTYVENSILKARHASKVTGLPAIADDSGLSVEYLDGQPGIYSARFSGPGSDDKKNRDLLLKKLEGVPFEKRHASYHAVITLLHHHDDPTPYIAHGIWHGIIAKEEKGEFGFGYDSLFIVPDLGCHAAELDVETKQNYSHRGIALRKLTKYLSTNKIDR
ncbi:MAG: RdgB/HAM1 family non-canonical purine NTP pyrophosphatase [Pseudomonadales bacterium]|nr:RdgB/HAM1 family non-canonical purine NTP pyrophosphatase [Pseudomonadales bacterium]